MVHKAQIGFEFEFSDLNGVRFKVRLMSGNEWWLYRKLRDGRFVSVRRVRNYSFNDAPTELDIFYESHQKEIDLKTRAGN